MLYHLPKTGGLFSSSIGQSVGDGLYKGLTGQEKNRDLTDGGTLRFGQTFTDQGLNPKKADFGDMTRQAKTKGTDVANQKVQNIMNTEKNIYLQVTKNKGTSF